MDKLKQMLLYLLVLAVAFFVIPLFVSNTGAFMIVLLALFPALCLGVSIIYGSKYGFDIIYIILVAVLFAITIFLYYNTSAWVYIVAYFGITLLGDAIGALIKLRKDKNKKDVSN